MFKDFTLPRALSHTQWALVPREKGGGGGRADVPVPITQMRKLIRERTFCLLRRPQPEHLSPEAKETT